MTTYHVPDDEAAPVPGRHTGPLATDADQQPDTLPHKRQRPILFPQLPPLQFDDHAVYLSPEEEDDALYPAMPLAPAPEEDTPVPEAGTALDPLAAATLPDAALPEPPPTPSHLSPTGEPTLAPARGSIPVRLLLLMSLLCLLTLLVSLFLTVGAPEATVTLVPDSRLLSTALVVTARPHPQGQDIAARLLTASSLSRQASAVTTGQGYQPAQAAHGWLTFYNAAPYAQTVAAGTTLTAADGVSVVTEQAVRLPAGNPPVFGIAEVAAHAATTGPQGNIPALDLNGLCCLPGVSVKNTAAFVGGQAARHFATVVQSDVERLANPLLSTLSQQAQVALWQQMRPNEQLAGLVQCQAHVASTPAVGSEATHVTVQVSASCQAEVYDQQAVEQYALGRLQAQAAALGPGYHLVGSLNLTMAQEVRTASSPDVLTLLVRASGRWSYQVSASDLSRMAQQIAGRSLQEATRRLQGLAQGPLTQVRVQLGGWWWWSRTTLPTDVARIQMVEVTA